MTGLDFLPPDPGLVERIRQGLHAHQAENGVRAGLVRPAPGPATPDATGRPTPRPAAATPRPPAAGA